MNGKIKLLIAGIIISIMVPISTSLIIAADKKHGESPEWHVPHVDYGFKSKQCWAETKWPDAYHYSLATSENRNCESKVWGWDYTRTNIVRMSLWEQAQTYWGHDHDKSN